VCLGVCKVNSRKTKKKNKIKANRFYVECVFEGDREFDDETVSAKIVANVKKKMKKTTGITSVTKSKIKATKKEQPRASAGVDESCSAQQRVAQSPETIDPDSQMPERTCPEHRLQRQERDHQKDSERSDDYGTTKESTEVEESPRHLTVYPRTRHGVAAAATAAADDDDDVKDAVYHDCSIPVYSEAENSTVRHAETDRITVRPASAFSCTQPHQNALHSSVSKTPAVERSPHQTLMINHIRSECCSAVPTCSHADVSELGQATHDTASPPQNKELHRVDEDHHQTSADSPCFGSSASLSDIYLLLRELTVELQQSEPSRKEAKEDTAEALQVKPQEHRRQRPVNIQDNRTSDTGKTETETGNFSLPFALSKL